MKPQITEIGSIDPAPNGMIKLDNSCSSPIAALMTWYPVQVHQLITDEDNVWVYVTPEAYAAYNSQTTQTKLFMEGRKGGQGKRGKISGRPKSQT